MHRGLGTLILSVATFLVADGPWVRSSALAVAALALSTQTPLGFVRVAVPDAATLRAAATRSGTACDLAGIHEELKRIGEPGLDRTTARRQVGADYGSPGTSPLVLETALRLDLVTDDEVAAITARQEFTRLFDKRQSRLAFVLPEHAAFVRALIRTQPLKDVARANLVAAIREAMPERPRTGALDAFASGCRLLELLPGAYDAGELRPRAHTLLAACWVPPTFGTTVHGGFGDELSVTSRKPSAATLGATRTACELVRRFGAPPEVDVAALRAALSARTSAEGRFFRTPGALVADAGLALRYLEGNATAASPWWLRERDLLGAFALALLTLVSGRRSAAPARDS